MAQLLRVVVMIEPSATGYTSNALLSPPPLQKCAGEGHHVKMKTPAMSLFILKREIDENLNSRLNKCVRWSRRAHFFTMADKTGWRNPEVGLE